MGRIDVLDLVTEHFDTPRFRRFVKLVYDLSVDVGSLLERFIEFDLSDLATQCRLGKLGDRKHVIPDSVGGALGVKHFEVQDAVHPHLHVVTRDADLFRDVQGRLFQRVAVADGIDKRDQNVEPRIERSGVLSKPLDNILALLWDDHGCPWQE